MPEQFITPYDLATRWCLPRNTLTQWRWNGRGPEFHKMGRTVRYRLKDIEDFEEEQRRKNTSEESASKEILLPRLLKKKRG